jgi:hypothetical protein
MDAVGEIASIVSSDYVIVKSEEELSPQSRLTVFQILEDERLKPLGLESLVIPKGEVVIVAKQSPVLYLATTITLETVTRAINVPSVLSKLGLQTVRQEVPREFHAHVDEAQSLKLPVERAIRVGDKVAHGVE